MSQRPKRALTAKLPSLAAVYYPEEDATGILPTTRFLENPPFEVNSLVTINWSKDLQPPALIISLSDCRQQLEDAIKKYEEAMDEETDDTEYTPPKKKTKEPKGNKLPQKENLKDKTDIGKGKQKAQVLKEVQYMNRRNDTIEGPMMSPGCNFPQKIQDKINMLLIPERTAPETITPEDTSCTTTTTSQERTAPETITPEDTFCTTTNPAERTTPGSVTSKGTFFTTTTTSETIPKSITPESTSYTTTTPERTTAESITPESTSFATTTTSKKTIAESITPESTSFTTTTPPDRTTEESITPVSTSFTTTTPEKTTAESITPDGTSRTSSSTQVKSTSNTTREQLLAVSTPDPKYLSTTLPVLNLSEYFSDLEDSFVAKQHRMMQTVEENRQTLKRIEESLEEIKCKLRQITSTPKTQDTTTTGKAQPHCEQTVKESSSQTTNSPSPRPSIFANIEILATSDDPPTTNKPTSDSSTAARRIAKSIFESVEALAVSSKSERSLQPHKFGSSTDYQQNNIAFHKQRLPLNTVDFLELRSTEN